MASPFSAQDASTTTPVTSGRSQGGPEDLSSLESPLSFENPWCFRPDHLEHTPSLRPKGTDKGKGPMTLEEEDKARSYGCAFIFAVGSALNHPQVVICTACTFFQRFYMIKRFQQHATYDIAATCLLLASKSEEAILPISSLARACAQKALKRRDPSLHELKKWEELIIYNESVVLDALSFDLVVEHPYTYLLQYAEDRHVPRKTVTAAWGFINESYRTPLTLLHSPLTIASAALAVGCAYNPAEGRDPEGRGWWEGLGADPLALQDAVKTILEQGNQPGAPIPPPPSSSSASASSVSTPTTSSASSNSSSTVPTTSSLSNGLSIPSH